MANTAATSQIHARPCPPVRARSAVWVSSSGKPIDFKWPILIVAPQSGSRVRERACRRSIAGCDSGLLYSLDAVRQQPYVTHHYDDWGGEMVTPGRLEGPLRIVTGNTRSTY